MAKEDFVKFYQEYLPKNKALQAQVDAITNEEEFAKKVLDLGPKAGFSFSRSDVETVMKASEQAIRTKELSDAQLDAVAGGAAVASAVPVVQITSLSSVSNVMNRPSLNIPNLAAESTIMCCW